LLQPYPLATLVIGNINFWTVFGIWLSLVLDAWDARGVSRVRRGGLQSALALCP
jgi:hypothetical protein